MHIYERRIDHWLKTRPYYVALGPLWKVPSLGSDGTKQEVSDQVWLKHKQLAPLFTNKGLRKRSPLYFFGKTALKMLFPRWMRGRVKV